MVTSESLSILQKAISNTGRLAWWTDELPKPSEIPPGQIDQLLEAISNLNRKLDRIFGGHVLVNGRWVNTSGGFSVENITRRMLDR